MEKSFDIFLWGKRIALVAISIAIGFLLTYGIIYLELRFPSIIPIADWMELTPLTAQGKQFTLNTTFEDYGFRYTLLTTLAFACAIGIWLDKIMATKILPS